MNNVNSEGRLMVPDEIKVPGDIVTAETVIERTGSHVWRVLLSDGRDAALKYATADADPFGITRALVAREAAVLAHLDLDTYLIGSGETERGSWLATKWLDGPTLWHHWQNAHRGDASVKSSALEATWRAATTVAQLHDSGWRHCDLQGAHIIVPEQGPARLIDFGVAQGPAEITPEVPYRGGFGHLTAPEIAAELLHTPNSHNVTLTAAAEAYTFGAVVFAGWAKQWPRDYGIDPSEIRAPELYEAITSPATLRPMPSGWPRMADLVAQMLDQQPGNRPTLAEVRDSLAEQMHSDGAHWVGPGPEVKQ
jgi:serine/threonine protein kinase